jgi:hypothetical protein
VAARAAWASSSAWALLASYTFTRVALSIAPLLRLRHQQQQQQQQQQQHSFPKTTTTTLNTPLTVQK